ncbi:hypothetical protein GJ744_000994 [Endocarpon pusillum]|uniref:Uncharacterized protein n=1 Tax=Endocarpon pusillum TaxID=364733 RepID=A0A8H7AAS2_9EURO|nr:hypothetical protein GJ744_000994 [Endocarpon pusillum]
MVGTVLQDPEPKMDVSELEKQLLRIAEGGEGNIETLLSEEGVNINVTNEFRETPLHRASWHGNEEIVKALLKHKADINIQDVDGWTPLYNAAMTDRVSIVNLLLSPPGPPPDARATTTSSTKLANMNSSDRRELRESRLRSIFQINMVEHHCISQVNTDIKILLRALYGIRQIWMKRILRKVLIRRTTRAGLPCTLLLQEGMPES